MKIKAIFSTLVGLALSTAVLAQGIIIDPCKKVRDDDYVPVITTQGQWVVTAGPCNDLEILGLAVAGDEAVPIELVDSDGDGIYDAVDRCPAIFGLAKNLGCPEVEEEVIVLLDEIEAAIEFDFDKSFIREVSKPKLNELAELLKDHPEYILKIGGHTDAIGSDDYNVDLSRRRASSVRDYLIKGGADGNKIIFGYFGEQIPKATNATAAGRQTNRRVELEIVFY